MIAGFLSSGETDPETQRKLARALEARGPGAPAQDAEGPLGLLQRGRGRSSASIAREGARCVAIDGALEAGGPQRGTEALAALAKGGVDALASLRGPFALAFWDGQELVLARDRFGQRPLVYVETPRGLWFASDASLLKAAGAPLGGIDRAALSDYLELLCVPAPRSIWTAARKLPAGHFLRVRRGRIEQGSFAALPVPGAAGTKADLGRVRELLDRAVARAAAVDAAAVVVGGTTSGAPLLALARRDGPAALPTVAVGYSAEDPQLALSRRFSPATHREVILEGAVLTRAHEALSACAEPVGDASALAAFAALDALGSSARHALTPHGGAAVFADADRYRVAARVPHSRRAGRLAEILRWFAPRGRRRGFGRAARALSSRAAERVRALAEAFPADDRRALLHSEARTAPAGAAQPEGDLDAALAFDLEVLLPERFLPALDAAGERSGIETLSPFLDEELAAAVVPVRARDKVRRGGLLNACVRDLLPPGVLPRRSRGKAPPLGEWMRGPFRIQLEDLLRPPTARIRTFLDPSGVDAMLAHSLAANGDARQAFALLQLELWARGPGAR